jgi:hypothetical protein
MHDAFGAGAPTETMLSLARHTRHPGPPDPACHARSPGARQPSGKEGPVLPYPPSRTTE